MKIPILLALMSVLLILAPADVQAQISFRFSDLFKQNKKERRNLLQSIVELQVYIGQLRKGYELVNDGLQTVRAIKKGEFDLHDLYYLSKKQVSPAVRQYPAAVKALAQSQQVQQQIHRFLRRLHSDTLLSVADKKFIRSTCSALIADVDSNTEDLYTLLSDGKLELSDQQRIGRIQKVLLRSTQQLVFSKNFCNSAQLLANGKKSEAAENAVLQGYYHLTDKKP